MKLKKFTPKSLYGRFLLIIVIPVLTVQLVSIYVFYYNHIDVISKYMARVTVEEISFIKKSINKPKYNQLLKDFSSNISLEFSYDNNDESSESDIIIKNKNYTYISPIIDPYYRLRLELEGHNLVPYEIYKTSDDKTIIIKIPHNKGTISFFIPKKRITSSSTYIFTFWMIMTALITSIISIIFLKNQVRSIKDLSKAAEKLGKGLDVAPIKPYGSKEIRSLGLSFIKMQERVIRQISQRTDMLSGVSHDLRTPLTRIKLQLEMMEQSPEINDLKSDISDMEKLVEEYLNFARNDDKEGLKTTLIKEFLEEKIINYYAKMSKKIDTEIHLDSNFKAPIKKLALKRALINLIDNAFNHASEVKLLSSTSNKNLIIIIDDNGPGIPEEETKNVLKPFYRIDNSRNLDKKSALGGSGLGLAIAADAITSHGGHIRLSKSPLGGLRVTIFIPK